MPLALSPVRRCALPAATLISLMAAGHPAAALEPGQMLAAAKTACLEAADRNGWPTGTAQLIAARRLDQDRAEVILSLTRNGTDRARLSCRYSVSQGGLGMAGAAPAGVVAPLPPLALAVPADRRRAWWLLLPIGLGLLAWAGLRAREERAPRAGTTGAGALRPQGSGRWLAEAAADDGLLVVREQADADAAVLHRVRNGDGLRLSGLRRGDWLELSQGGWVRESDVRYDRGTVTFR